MNILINSSANKLILVSELPLTCRFWSKFTYSFWNEFNFQLDYHILENAVTKPESINVDEFEAQLKSVLDKIDPGFE
jgi:hypothetical protein